MLIHNHQLKGVLQFQTPNNSGQMHALPSAILIHYTGVQNHKSVYNAFMNPKHKASANIVIDDNGDVYQFAPLNQVTWHAGRSVWDGRSSLNWWSIGIELVNAGPVTTDTDIYGYPIHGKVRALHKNQTEPKNWARYTPKQYNACAEVVHAIKESYPIEWVLGHDDVSPQRKQDPGPAFDFERIGGWGKVK